LPDEPLGRPVRHANLAATAAHAQEFGRGLVLIGSEHHTEGRDDNVEAIVGKRQRFGIRLAELDFEAVGRCALAAAIEQRPHVVGRGHVAPAARGSERHVAVSGRDVEHLAASPKIEGLAQVFADDLEGRTDDGVVAG
jgi:hypothetical protein